MIRPETVIRFCCDEDTAKHIILNRYITKNDFWAMIYEYFGVPDKCWLFDEEDDHRGFVLLDF